MHIPSTIDPQEFVRTMITKYQEAKSPSDRKRANALVTMALRAKLISETDRDRFDKEKEDRKNHGVKGGS